MLSAHHIVRLQDTHTALWHGPETITPELDAGPLPPPTALDRLVIEQHRANFDLWHQEDDARAPGASDATLAAVKRSIDVTNQRRNDLTEKIDHLLLANLDAAGSTHPEAELHSETPGLMIDRLSILSLKLFHTREELERVNAPPGHGERNQERLRLLIEQRGDLEGCLARLWQQICTGQRRFKVYRQLKMYNDPELNPAIYGRGLA
jgi:Protein of unknown function (DUF4254)